MVSLRFLLPLVVLVLNRCQFSCAKAVFAHFMVSNAANYTISDWEDDIQLAQEAHITAFALNFAYNEGVDVFSIAKAFVAAEEKNFQLFFSFDYAGRGPFHKENVITMMNMYKSNRQYYRYNGQPFVSTFEGPENAEDWIDIKDATGCFFAGGVADGLFSWAAWPWGPQDMDTYVDASYMNYLNGKPYMMPVSPWFYTNLPQWKKNWMWRGDNLWFDRWQEVNYIQPEWVQIISWNDYGESHYIGPIRDKALGAMTSAPFNYVKNMPHDSWRAFLNTTIDTYVQNTTAFLTEGVTFWYRPNPAGQCSDGQTRANTASQLQLEFSAAQAALDAVFFTARLADNKTTVTVSIGGVSTTAKWRDIPDTSIGYYHGNSSFNSRTGAVVVSLVRDGGVIATATGTTPITSNCNSVNWNAWVGEAWSSKLVLGGTRKQDKKVCVRGTGANDFAPMCAFACQYGYCPVGACTCTDMGFQQTKPNYTDVIAYPVAGRSADYSGLCAFNCNIGKIGDPGCPSNICGTVEVPLTVPTVSPFLPPTCTGGKGPAGSGFEGLCDYSCHFGFCPTQICTCTSTGTLNLPPPKVSDTVGSPISRAVNDWGLCDFACPRGYCPTGSCNQKPRSGGGKPVYIDDGVWGGPGGNPAGTIPKVGCEPPCVIVLPPIPLPAPTTIPCPPLTTTLTESWVAGSSLIKVTTITFTAITTNLIPVFNINITDALVDHATYKVTPSLFCVAPMTVYPPPGVTITRPSHPPGVTITASDSSSSSTDDGWVYWVTKDPEPGTTTSSADTKISFISTTPAFPTCTRPAGCGGEVCTAGCSDCDKNSCSCMDCCDKCRFDDDDADDDDDNDNDDDDDDNDDHDDHDDDDGGCVGKTCPPGSGPGGAGGSGGPGPCQGASCPPGSRPGSDGSGGGCSEPNCDDCPAGSNCNPGDGSNDQTCTSKNTVIHTTVHCKLSAPPGKRIMETTCTPTGSSTSVGCSLTPTRTTTYTSSGCPTRKPYTPLWNDYLGAVPLPGDPAWGGYWDNTGTYGCTTTTTTATHDGPVPTPSRAGRQASWKMNWYRFTSPEKDEWMYWGFDDAYDLPYCEPNISGTWSKIGNDVFESLPDTLTGTTVYGDQAGCTFTKADMKVRCKKWATATCAEDKFSGGTCRVDAEKGIFQRYRGMLGCSW